MFNNLRRNVSRLVYPEVHLALLESELRRKELARGNSAIHDTLGGLLKRQLAQSHASSRADSIKALNWDHLVKSHESGELEGAFVVCRLDEQGVLSPITCQKDELSAAIYIDRTKHGAVKAN